MSTCSRVAIASCCRAAASPAAPSPPRPLQPKPHPHPRAAARAALLLRALLDPALLPRAAWFSFFQMALLALFTGCTAYSKRAPTPIDYAVLQAIIAAAALSGAVLVARLQPYSPQHSWKTPIVSSLYVLTALTAVFNAVLYFVGARGGNTALRWALGGLRG